MWELPFLMCDIYISFDVICSTASILNLVAISFDRSACLIVVVDVLHSCA